MAVWCLMSPGFPRRHHCLGRAPKWSCKRQKKCFREMEGMWRACGGHERMHVFTIKYNQRLNMVEWCWMLIASCFHLIFGWEVARTFPLNLCHRSFYHSSLQVQVVNHEQLRTKEGLRWVALWLLPVFPEPMWAAMFTDHLVSSWSVDWLVPDDIRLPAHGPKPTWHEQPLGIFLC